MDDRVNGHGSAGNPLPDEARARLRASRAAASSASRGSLRAADQMARLEQRIHDFQRHLASLDAAEGDVARLSLRHSGDGGAPPARPETGSRRIDALRPSAQPPQETMNGAGRPADEARDLTAMRDAADAIRANAEHDAEAIRHTAASDAEATRVAAMGEAESIREAAAVEAEAIRDAAVSDAETIRQRAESDMAGLWVTLETEVATIQAEISRRVDRIATRMEAVETEAADRRAEAQVEAEHIISAAREEAEEVLQAAEDEATRIIEAARRASSAAVARPAERHPHATGAAYQAETARERRPGERIAEQIRDATVAVTRRVSRIGEGAGSEEDDAPSDVAAAPEAEASFRDPMMPESVMEVVDALASAVSLVERSLTGLSDLLGHALGDR